MKKRLIAAVAGILVIAFAMGGCATQEKKIVIGSKPHTEQYIIAEMLTQLIETHTKIKVEKKFGIGGGTANIHPAVLKGDIDLYPEYTGTGWMYVLKNQPMADAEALYAQVSKEYMDKYKIKWLGRYGFNNTYAIAVKKEVAQSLNLVTMSDLGTNSGALVFGANYDFFERADGFKGMANAYSMKFKGTKEMDIGLKYEAIRTSQVDVINAFSTDALLKQYELTVMKDDKNFFPSYQAATVVRSETLQKYPELEKVIAKLDGQINDQTMMELNYKIEVEKKDAAVVAKEFLKSKGLI